MYRSNRVLFLVLAFATCGLSAMNPSEISRSKKMINNAIAQINNPTTPLTKAQQLYNNAMTEAKKLGTRAGVPTQELQAQLQGAMDMRVQRGAMRGEMIQQKISNIRSAIPGQAATIGAEKMEMKEWKEEGKRAAIARQKEYNKQQKLKKSEENTLQRIADRNAAFNKKLSDVIDFIVAGQKVIGMIPNENGVGYSDDRSFSQILDKNISLHSGNSDTESMRNQTTLILGWAQAMNKTTQKLGINEIKTYATPAQLKKLQQALEDTQVILNNDFMGALNTYNGDAQSSINVASFKQTIQNAIGTLALLRKNLNK